MPKPTERNPAGPQRCKAKNKDGKRCKAWALQGAEVCRMHGGGAPQVKRKAAERMEEAKARVTLAKAMQLFDLEGGSEPGIVLLREMTSAGATAEWLRNKVADLPEEEAAGVMKYSEKFDEETQTWTITYLAGVNVWIKLYAEWSERAAKMAKMALDAGIAERQVRILEAQASVFANIMYGVLKDLDVEVDENAMTIIRRHLMSLNTIEVQG